MADHRRREDLRQTERSNEKEQKEESVEENIEAQKKRRIILSSLIALGIIIVAISGFWYLQRPRNSGTLAPDFSLTDLDGNTFRLSDFRGKVVVIDFMATWCGPCRMEMPHFGTIWEKYENKIVLMSIDIDPFRETEETLRDFAQEFPYATWIWAMDTANLGQAYQVTGIPKTVIIDQDGYIRFTHTRVTPASTFIQEIDQLLG
ncbi:MAG: TlpA family protein disulfide reductase [Candidatus Bathyarchaeia archaeon]